MKTKIISILVVTLLITSFLIIFGAENVSADCPDGMIAYWKFDEGSGTVAYDSFDANDGTIYDAIWTDGICGEALEFDGIDDYVDIPPLLTSNDAGTISLWFYTCEIIDTSSHVPLLSIQCPREYGEIPNNEYPRRYLILGDVTSLLENEIFGVLGDQRYLNKLRSAVSSSQLNSISVGWHHFVLASDVSGHVYYLDGVKYVPDLFNDGWSASSNLFPVIGGGRIATTSWIGGGKATIDEVAIYNRALSDDEISSHYYAGLDGRGYCEIIKEVTIDIKPGSYPNSINPNSRGEIPVAVLTMDEFNASTVNPITVEFLSATPCKKEKLEDINNDGTIDMLFHFKTQECDFELLVDEGDEYPYAYMTGETIDEQFFEGKDTIRLIEIDQKQLKTIFSCLFERFPNLFPILNWLLQRLEIL